MKITNLAMIPAFVTSLLAGCAMEPGDELADDGDAAQAAQGDTSDQAGSEDVARDARAAAAAEAQSPGKLGTVSVNPTLATWYTGSIAVGATQHWYWNNANLTHAFQVGLSPVGASTASACQLEVTRTYDVQKYGGEREFHFDIKNTGSIACGANILLDSKARSSTWDTGGIEPGASKSWTWNNASPITASFFVGVSPSGATSANNCSIEVTRTWYVEQPTGEREFKFTVKNIGAIACQGDIQLAATSSVPSIFSTGVIPVGGTYASHWNNANPLTRLYVPGLAPAASSTTACQLEITQTYYRQVIGSDGSAEREFYFVVKNIGSLACGASFLLNNLD
jgi:hypothetical protein